MSPIFRLTILVCLGTFPWEIQAYIGPGMGTGVIAVVLGILCAIFLALFAILWYPIKRLFKKNPNQSKKPQKGKKQQPEPDTNESG